jgi:glucosamine kinase
LIASPTEQVRYVIGVDGGGTGTRARVTLPGGAVLGFAEAGPSALGQGIEQAWASVLDAVDQAFRVAGVVAARREECALGLGVAGAIVRTRYDRFLRAAPPFARIALDSDAYATLLGAHRGRPGAAVVAGTGSAGEALRDNGDRVSLGGWGFPIGDEGSGAWLGLRAMQRAQHALDGRVAPGPLVNAIFDTAGSSREALLAWGELAGQHAYARLAPLVFDASATDAWAMQLLDDAALSLENLAMALDPAGALPLVVCGSVGRRLAPRFTAVVRSRLVEPAGDALDGALCLIRRTLASEAR